MTNQSGRKSFIIHKDSLSVLKKLKDDQAGKLFKAIAFYQEDKTLPKDELISIIFEPFLNQFIRDDESYQKVCETRRIAGSKGGKQKVANASKCKQNIGDSDSDSDNKNKKESDILLESQFESFWNLYNKKVSRADVDKKFRAALKKETFDNIMTGLNSYVKSRGVDSKYWKNPSTWLNQECWNDEYHHGSKPVVQDKPLHIRFNNFMNYEFANRIEESNKVTIYLRSPNFKIQIDNDPALQSKIKEFFNGKEVLLSC